VDLPLDRDLAVGIMATLPSPSKVRETAGAVDEFGFDSVWVGDHVLLYPLSFGASPERIRENLEAIVEAFGPGHSRDREGQVPARGDR
jgi:hypothetical protein